MGFYDSEGNYVPTFSGMRASARYSVIRRHQMGRGNNPGRESKRAHLARTGLDLMRMEDSAAAERRKQSRRKNGGHNGSRSTRI